MRFVRNVLIADILLFAVALAFCITVGKLKAQTLSQALFWLGGIVLFGASLISWGSTAGRFDYQYWIARTLSVSSSEEKSEQDLADHERSHSTTMTLVAAGSIAVALSFVIG